MPEDGLQKPPPSKEEARKIFQRSVMDGSLISTRHARKRMKEYSRDHNDVLELARSGMVFNEPEPDIKTGELVYRIESQRIGFKGQFICVSESCARLLTVMNDTASSNF
jgi:hypothetical protein